MQKRKQKHFKIIVNIIATLFCGMFLTILPCWGTWFYPSWVLMTLVFWLIFFPTYVNLFVFWVVGLLMDVLTGTLIGQTAFIFVMTAYIIMRFFDRFFAYVLWRQCLLWILITSINMLIIYSTNALTGDFSFHVVYISTILLNALFWPIILFSLSRLYRVLITHRD